MGFLFHVRMPDTSEVTCVIVVVSFSFKFCAFSVLLLLTYNSRQRIRADWDETTIYWYKKNMISLNRRMWLICIGFSWILATKTQIPDSKPDFIIWRFWSKISCLSTWFYGMAKDNIFEYTHSIHMAHTHTHTQQLAEHHAGNSFTYPFSSTHKHTQNTQYSGVNSITMYTQITHGIVLVLLLIGSWVIFMQIIAILVDVGCILHFGWMIKWP